MEKTKFDLLVEHMLNIAEGRKPKQYNKMVIDFDKLESDINGLSDQNPFKKLYQHAISGLKSYGGDNYFSNEEMSQEAKTLPEWEEAINNAFLGHSLSKLERKRFGERFFNFVKDPDREYFSEYVAEPSVDKSIASMEQHIFDYVSQSDEESTTKEEIVQYIARYGHDSEEVSKVIEKMVTDGQLIEMDGKFKAANDPSDDVDPEDADLDKLSTTSEDPTEIFANDRLEDEEDEKGARIPPELADEFGIDANDPFGDEDYLRSTD